jgi:hypothetical protein
MAIVTERRAQKVQVVQIRVGVGRVRVFALTDWPQQVTTCADSFAYVTVDVLRK